ncbi:MAG: hypothetical protein GX190_03470 [Mollicutes bacterium]|nr:hypothetical protein [Mollicutes bacterium]
MKSKKGFTIAELVLSFSISSMVIVLLFQLLLSLKDLYNMTGYKTEMLIKQATISKQINEVLSANTIIGIEDCGVDCILFSFDNGSNKELSINREHKIINFGDFSTKLVKDSEFGEPNIMFYRNYGNVNNRFNSFILIDIPIYYPLYEDENFGINVVYQYNSNEQLLIEEEF